MAYRNFYIHLYRKREGEPETLVASEHLPFFHAFSTLLSVRFIDTDPRVATTATTYRVAVSTTSAAIGNTYIALTGKVYIQARLR